MSYSVRPGNVFGRIGEGLGKGLAESIPKEAERYRLRQGLEELNQKKGLTPAQKLATVGTLPGVSPTLMQGLANLYQMERIGAGYRDLAGKDDSVTDSTQSKDGSTERGARPDSSKSIAPKERILEGSESDDSRSMRTKSELDPSLQPRMPYTQKERDSRVAEVYDHFKDAEFAKNYVDSEEKRYLAQPEFERQLQDYYDSVSQKFKTSLDKELYTDLQKQDKKDLYRDISGEDINDMTDLGIKEMAKNPGMKVDDLTRKISRKALEASKARTKVEEEIGKWVSVSPEAFARALDGAREKVVIGDNYERYYNLLKEKQGMSDHVAAQAAYPISKEMKETLNLVSENPMKKGIAPYLGKYLKKNQEVEIARKVKDNIKENDSILKIMKLIRDKNEYFDFDIFLNEVRSGKNSFNERQSRELNHADFPVVGNWGDIYYKMGVKK